METTTHTINDLIEIYGDILIYIRQDAEVHDPTEHDEDDDYCPAKLYERGQAVYDASKLWRLMRAAPALLDALRDSSQALSDFYAVDHIAAGQHFGMPLRERVESAIKKAV